MVESSIFLMKAQENLQAAQLCHDHGLHNACASRAYYGMFQAAAAILIARGFAFDSKKHLDHAQVQSLFANELINRRKIFQGRFKSYLYDAEFLRGVADYKTISISHTQAKRQMHKAKEFIDAIKKELHHDQS